MKCTIRKVNEGIIATSDERPEIGDWSYYIRLNIITKIENEWEEYAHNDGNSFKVIGAENIEGLKIIAISINKRYALNNNIESIYKKKLNNAIGKDYSYRIESEKLIITL